MEWIEREQTGSSSIDTQLASYRVVQEAPTSAIKYAPGQPTVVQVSHGDEQVEVDVTDEGSVSVSLLSVAPASIAAGGRGLNGLRERVRLLDGELVAETQPGGGFRVHALIPSRSNT